VRTLKEETVRIAIFVIICGALATAFGVDCANAAQSEGDPPRDPYALVWWSMDGGGGPSAGGDFDLLGTIGQPDVGRAVGGTLEVAGGFLAGGESGLVFADGFELGNTNGWSATTGDSEQGGGE